MKQKTFIVFLFVFFATGIAAKEKRIKLREIDSTGRREPKLIGKKITVNTDGSIKSTYKRGLGLSQPIRVDLTRIQERDSMTKANFKDNVVEHIKHTIDILEDSESKHTILYTHIVGKATVDSMVQDLYTIYDGLADTSGYKQTRMAEGSTFYLLDSLCNSYFSAQNYKKLKPYIIESVRGREGARIRMVRIDLFKEFMIKYYNAAITATQNETIRKYGKSSEDFNKMLKDSLNDIDKVEIARVCSVLKNSNISIDTIKHYCVQYGRRNNRVKFFQSPWMWQMIWFNKGIAEINPLPFVSEELVPKNDKISPEDSTQLSMYNLYLRDVTRKFMLDSTEKDVDKYKKMVLDKMAKADGIYRDVTIYKNELAKNNQNRNNFLTCRYLENDILLPYKSKYYASHHVQYSATDTVFGNKTMQLKATNIESSVCVTVHNIPKGDTVMLTKTSSKGIKDISPITEGLNNSLDLLSSTVTTAVPYKDIVNLVLPNKNFRRGGIPLIQKYERNKDTKSLDSAFSSREEIKDSLHKYNDSIVYSNIRQHLEMAYMQYLQADSAISRAYTAEKALPPPIATLPTTGLSSARYRTAVLATETIDSATKWNYKVVNRHAVDDKIDTLQVGAFSYRTGKRYRLQASIGITYTGNAVTQNEVTVTNGVVSLASTTEHYGVAACIHYYPFNKGVLLQDNSLLGGNLRQFMGRMNIMAGLDFRKVPDNLYLGIGYDLGPGIKLNLGMHFYSYTQYELSNNQIKNETTTYKIATPFIYVGIDPVSFLKAVSILK